MAWTVLSAEEQVSLARRIRDGDPAAEEVFARLFGERIRVMMLVRIRDAETARELTQDVMFAAWRAIHQEQLRDPERLAAFVLAIARNVANSYIRSHADDPLLQPLTAEAAGRVPAAEEEPDAERRAQVEAALGRLSADDRQVLRLTLVQGLKPREIAASLGLSVEVVRARKSRAIKRIVAAMAEMSRIGREGH